MKGCSLSVGRAVSILGVSPAGQLTSFKNIIILIILIQKQQSFRKQPFFKII
jgi:hypothetical protein